MNAVSAVETEDDDKTCKIIICDLKGFFDEVVLKDGTKYIDINYYNK